MNEPMRIGGYEIEIVVQGFPGKSVCHGGLGWSSVVLLRGEGRVALIDAGSFSMRKLLIERLKARGLKSADVTDVLLTHSHHDHAVNWTLFRQARIVIGAQELDWSLTQPWGETPVPELYMEKLADWPTVHRARDGEAVLPHISAHVAPGHTPGHLIYVLEGAEHDIIFTGDAAKNRAELLSRRGDMTYDADLTAKTIEGIMELWRRRPGSVLVPGHDLPIMLEGGGCRYLGRREAAISAWFGDTLEQTTMIELAVR